MAARPLIFDLDPDSLRELLVSRGWPAYRATQVLEWVYRKAVDSPEAMSNLSPGDRAALGQWVRFGSAQVIKHQLASDGVQKLLTAWPTPEDPESPESPASSSSTVAPATTPLPLAHQPTPAPSAGESECVMIPTDDRKTACVSSQVGCPVGCRFCASGIGGLERNLTAGQIVEQVWRLSRLEAVGRISHVVFMGMGEPLANFDQVVKAIATLTAPWGMGISGRRITVSTVGVPAPIRRLADLQLPVTLALSLHAPNDDLRRRLIPWADYVTIAQLLDACRYYFDRTGREITLEYILLGDVNDREEHARELAQLARTLRANVNLIRFNEVRGVPFKRPRSDDVLRFQQLLQRAQVNAHIRASRGRDIAAACGQLRHETRQA